MPRLRLGPWALLSLLAIASCAPSARDRAVTEDRLGLGQPADSALIRALNIDAPPHGEGVPDGIGSASTGESLFVRQCAGCHSLNGARLAGPALAGLPDPGPRGSPRSLRAYWPYATTLFDYIGRAMPPQAPGTLTAQERYALTAYLLSRNGLWADSVPLDRAALLTVSMPARTRFFVDSTQW